VAEQWRVRHAHGDVVIVRWADDFIVGFEHRDDAERFLAELHERFAQFALELNDEKTRLIEFGRYAARDRQERGLGRPETFDFLGFTHICGKTRKGRFMLKRKTITKRMAVKLREVKADLMRRRHLPIPEQGRWLASVVRGHLAYYAVPGNIDMVVAFRTQATRHWHRALRRRSQRTSLNWERMNASQSDGSHPPASSIPGPTRGSTPKPKGRAQCGSPARWDLRGGRPATGVPTAIGFLLLRVGRLANFLPRFPPRSCPGE
jgi:RNA-directed DNA polymerase